MKYTPLVMAQDQSENLLEKNDFSWRYSISNKDSVNRRHHRHQTSVDSYKQQSKNKLSKLKDEQLAYMNLQSDQSSNSKNLFGQVKIHIMTGSKKHIPQKKSNFIVSLALDQDYDSQSCQTNNKIESSFKQKFNVIKEPHKFGQAQFYKNRSEFSSPQRDDKAIIEVIFKSKQKLVNDSLTVNIAPPLTQEKQCYMNNFDFVYDDYIQQHLNRGCLQDQVTFSRQPSMPFEQYYQKKVGLDDLVTELEQNQGDIQDGVLQFYIDKINNQENIQKERTHTNIGRDQFKYKFEQEHVDKMYNAFTKIETQNKYKMKEKVVGFLHSDRKSQIKAYENTQKAQFHNRRSSDTSQYIFDKSKGGNNQAIRQRIQNYGRWYLKPMDYQQRLQNSLSPSKQLQHQ